MLSSSLLFLRFLPCSFQVAACRLYSSLPTCHFLVLSRVSMTWKALGNSAVISCWTRIKLHVFIFFFFPGLPGKFCRSFFPPQGGDTDPWPSLLSAQADSLNSHPLPWADPRFPENLPPAQRFLEEQELLPNASSACRAVSSGSHCLHRSAEIWVLPSCPCGLIAFLVSIIQRSAWLLRCWCDLSASFPVVTDLLCLLAKRFLFIENVAFLWQAL